jgi:hypothetical protein
MENNDKVKRLKELFDQFSSTLYDCRQIAGSDLFDAQYDWVRDIHKALYSMSERQSMYRMIFAADESKREAEVA